MADETRGAANTPASTTASTFEVPPEIVFRNALANPTVPKLYANQFFTVIQPADIAFMFGLTGQAMGIVSMSYPIAKAFASKVQDAIAQYEKNTGATVSLYEVLETNLRNSSGSGDPSP